MEERHAMGDLCVWREDLDRIRMKIAIMQPYLFPYVGYFQLIAAVEKFIIYDDVAFIKQGWINRNRILLNGKAFFFTIPLKNASSFRRINEIEVDSRPADNTKLLKTFEQAYKRAPHYRRVIELVKDVLLEEEMRISAIALKSVKLICSYLGLRTPIVESSTKYVNGQLKSEERVIDICRQEGATEYVNAIGGRELYSASRFAAANLRLSFLQTNAVRYKQLNNEFIPGLSIIDVLMFNSREDAAKLLGDYQII